MSVIKLVPCKYCGRIPDVMFYRRTRFQVSCCEISCPSLDCRFDHFWEYIVVTGFLSKLRAYIEWNKVNKK